MFGAATIALNGTNTGTSRVNALTITGGRLDLTDNDLIVDTTPIATVAALIQFSFTGGSWTGAGLTSSAAQLVAGSAHKIALGYAAAWSIGVTVFDGQTVAVNLALPSPPALGAIVPAPVTLIGVGIVHPPSPPMTGPQPLNFIPFRPKVPITFRLFHPEAGFFAKCHLTHGSVARDCVSCRGVGVGYIAQQLRRIAKADNCLNASLNRL